MLIFGPYADILVQCADSQHNCGVPTESLKEVAARSTEASIIVVKDFVAVAQSIESTLRSRELVQSAGSPAQLRSCIGVGSGQSCGCRFCVIVRVALFGSMQSAFQTLNNGSNLLISPFLNLREII